MNNKKKQYKKPVAIGMAVAVALCLVGGIWMYFDSLPSEDPKKEVSDTVPVQHVYTADGVHRKSFYDPDWETDIFTVQRWLDKNRYISYKDGGMTVTMVDESYDEYGICVEFLAQYLETLMQGDAERLNGFYADSYFNLNTPYEKFTMQKLYDMVIEFISMKDAVNADGVTVTEYIYKLSYKILENDGTFRDDIESDASRPQFYYIVDDGVSLYITDVTYTLG